MTDRDEPPTVVVVGHEGDEHSDQLQALLAERGRVLVLRCARDQLPGAAFTCAPGGTVEIDSSRLVPNAAAGFWRRPSWPTLTKYAAKYSDFAADECIDAFDGAIEALGIAWLTQPQDLRRAELKIVQLRTALELGVPIPETLITNRTDAATDFARRVGHVIAKPVRYGLLADEPDPLVAFAAEVTTDELAELTGPPVILQKRIEALMHLRVVTTGSLAFVAELRTNAIDWRSDLANHQRFQRSASTIARRAGEQSLAIAKRLALGYSSQDWIRTTDDRLVFLEANPNGQWLFLDFLWGGGITRAIAERLELLAVGNRSGGLAA